MYAKHLIKQAEVPNIWENFGKGYPGQETNSGVKAKAPDDSSFQAGQNVPEEPMTPAEAGDKVWNATLGVGRNIRDNPIATAAGAIGGPFALFDGRNALSNLIEAGKSTGGTRYYPQPRAALNDWGKAYVNQGGRTPGDVLKDLNKPAWKPLPRRKQGPPGSIPRGTKRLYNWGALKPDKVNPLEVVRDATKLNRASSGAPRGKPLALLERLTRGGLSNKVLRKKPESGGSGKGAAWGIGLSSVLSGILSAIASAKAKKEINRLKEQKQAIRTR